jgi:DNA-directed RNA polymerase subunit RPC12/RpoP
VGEADSFIRFYCDNCGYKSTVSESYAGKQIRCPKCYYIILIPKAQPKATKPNKNGSERKKAAPKHSDYDLTLLNISEKEKLSTYQRGQTSISEEAYEREQETGGEPSAAETELVDERKLPWLIDIFLYPFSVPGLKSLAIFIGVPLLIDILWTILPIQLSCLFYLVTIVIHIVIFFYIYWYFTECVRDSADGGVRAPEGLGSTPGFMGMFWQAVNVIGCLAIFFAPFGLYMLYAGRADIIFWLLLIFAVFFFPMGLLAVIMFDSAIGLNPRLLVRSISSAFYPYCGLVLLFVTPVVLLGMLYTEVQESRLWIFIIRSVVTYLALVGAHILGRFYWRYQDKFNWDLEAEKDSYS